MHSVSMLRFVLLCAESGLEKFFLRSRGIPDEKLVLPCGEVLVEDTQPLFQVCRSQDTPLVDVEEFEGSLELLLIDCIDADARGHEIQRALAKQWPCAGCCCCFVDAVAVDVAVAIGVERVEQARRCDMTNRGRRQ